MEKVYVIWWWEYDMSSPLAVINFDKLDDYIEHYKNQIIENHNNNKWVSFKRKPEIKKIDIEKREDSVVFNIYYDEDWIWETYHNCYPYQNLTLEEMLERDFGVRHEAFEYTPFEINDFSKNKIKLK
jgi:hypothetical protein